MTDEQFERLMSELRSISAKLDQLLPKDQPSLRDIATQMAGEGKLSKTFPTEDGGVEKGKLP